jgi:hypothetical protein
MSIFINFISSHYIKVALCARVCSNGIRKVFILLKCSYLRDLKVVLNPSCMCIMKLCQCMFWFSSPSTMGFQCKSDDHQLQVQPLTPQQWEVQIWPMYVNMVSVKARIRHVKTVCPIWIAAFQACLCYILSLFL